MNDKIRMLFALLRNLINSNIFIIIKKYFLLAILIALVITFIDFLTRHKVQKMKTEKGINYYVSLGLFIFFLVIILAETLLSRGANSRITTDLFGFSYIIHSYGLLYAISNLILFIPFGLFLSKMQRKNYYLVNTTFALLLSSGIETLQLITGRGYFQVSDIVFNTLGAFLGCLISKGVHMNSNYYKIIMKSLKIKYGKNLLLKGLPMIYNKSGATMKIGNNVTIKSSFLSNLVGLYSKTIIVTRTENAKIIIGDNVGISGATIYARQGITIGENTLIGGNCKILDNDFHPIETEKRNKLLFENAPETGEKAEWIKAKEIEIGKNCFIGCNSIILKGTKLGEGCVVGAGAVVSGEFPENSVIAGNPAKIIKKVNE